MYRRPGFSPYLLVTTQRTQSAAFFWALSGALDASKIYWAMPSLDLWAPSNSTNLGVRVGWQLSNDQLTWPASTSNPTQFATATLASQSAEGVTYGAVWEDIHASMTARYLRWGAWVMNPTSTALETVLAAIRVDTRSCA